MQSLLTQHFLRFLCLLHHLLVLTALGLMASNAVAGIVVPDWSEIQWEDHLTLEPGDDQQVGRVSFSRDGSLVLATPASDVVVWNSNTGEELARLAHQRGTSHAAFSPDGLRLISTGAYRLARIWDIQSGELLFTFGDESHNMRPAIDFVAWPPQGPRAIQSADNWRLNVFDAISSDLLFTLESISTRTTQLIFSPDGKRIAAALADGTIRIFDAESGEQLLVHDRHEGEPEMAFSSDGSRMVSIGQDTLMEVWDTATGEVIQRWEERFRNSWQSPNFSPDGRHIIVISKNSWDRFQILDIESGEKTAALPRGESDEPQYNPRLVQFSPNGQSIMTADLASIRLWRHEEFVPVEHGRAETPPGREITEQQTAVEQEQVTETHTPSAEVESLPAEAESLPVAIESVTTDLERLASEGSLTVRALRGWGQLPERFSQLALELRRHDIDLLSADQATVEALIERAPDSPYLAERVDDLGALAELMASYAAPTPHEPVDGDLDSEVETDVAESLPPDGVPGWILVSSEDHWSENSDTSTSTFSFSFQTGEAIERGQVRQRTPEYLRQVDLAFDIRWDEPPRFGLKSEIWQGRIEITDAGTKVEYLSGSVPERDRRSARYGVSGEYRRNVRQSSAAFARFSTNDPDSVGTTPGGAKILWPDYGCPGDQFQVEMEVIGWSGKGTRVWTYEYHPNILRSPVFADNPDAKAAIVQRTPEPALENLEIFQDCADCPEMVVLPAGSFVMGSPESEHGRHEQEGPQITVEITEPFAMARTPVTQAQWTALTNSTPFGSSDCPDCPVENISHVSAREYLRILSEKTGHNYLLPSAAQWEYACRAGADHRYCGSNHIDDVAWYRCNSGHKTHPVATKAANAFGLHDMSGNVGEWTRDCHTEDYELMPTDGSPLIQDADCTLKVIRGGHWFDTEEGVRAAARSSGYIKEMLRTGFRPVRLLVAPDLVDGNE